MKLVAFGLLALSTAQHNGTHEMSSDACQADASYPLYCTAEEAESASPTGQMHANGAYYMAMGVTMHHGDYTGDAAACDCMSMTNGTDHHDHPDDHANMTAHVEACQSDSTYPLYCTMALAMAQSPFGEAHEHAGHWMPNGVTMVMDYTGDAMTCECMSTTDGTHSHGDDHASNMTAHDDEACKSDSTYPLYCTMALAMAQSPSSGAHEHAGHWMPNDVTMVMDYSGDAMACDCMSMTNGTDHHDHPGNMTGHADAACQSDSVYPLFCTMALAMAQSPSSGAHEHAGHWMPNGVTMVMDYSGDAMTCDCDTSMTNGTDHHSDHSDNHAGNMTGHADEACQSDASYPLFCTEAKAVSQSTSSGAHEHAGFWMPNSVAWFHGDYQGDAHQCNCPCQSERRFPLYCTLESALDASPTAKATLTGDFFVAANVTYDEDYTGDAQVCACVDGANGEANAAVEACQHDGDYPLYCTEATALAHTGGGVVTEANLVGSYYMPVSSSTELGTYVGDAGQCEEGCVEESDMSSRTAVVAKTTLALIFFTFCKL